MLLRVPGGTSMLGMPETVIAEESHSFRLPAQRDVEPGPRRSLFHRPREPRHIIFDEERVDEGDRMSSTTPSIGLPRMLFSTSMLARFRYSIAVGRSSVSPSDITGKLVELPRSRG